MPQEQMPEAQELAQEQSPHEVVEQVSSGLAKLMEMTDDDSVKQQLQSCQALVDGMSNEESEGPEPVSEAKSKGYVSANGGPKGVPVL